MYQTDSPRAFPLSAPHRPRTLLGLAPVQHPRAGLRLREPFLSRDGETLCVQILSSPSTTRRELAAATYELAAAIERATPDAERWIVMAVPDESQVALITHSEARAAMLDELRRAREVLALVAGSFLGQYRH